MNKRFRIFTELPRNLVVQMQYFSSGDLSYEELSKRDHPYSVRRPRQYLAYGNSFVFINKHSGGVYDGWNTDITDRSIHIWNSAPYFKDLVNGIRGLTVRRPILSDPKVIKRIDLILDHAVKDLIVDIKTTFRGFQNN